VHELPEKHLLCFVQFAADSRLLPVKLCNGGDDIRDSIARKLRIDGERQDFLRRRPRAWHVAGAITQITEAFLLVQGKRVVDLRSYPFGLQEDLKLVPLLAANNVLVKDVRSHAIQQSR
jgi:hypothetical protein